MKHTYSDNDTRIISIDGASIELYCMPDATGSAYSFTISVKDGEPTKVGITVFDGEEDAWGNPEGRDVATFAEAGIDWRDAYRDACAAVENSHVPKWLKDELSKAIEAFGWK